MPHRALTLLLAVAMTRAVAITCAVAIPCAVWAAPVPVASGGFATREVQRLIGLMAKERLVTFSPAGTLMLASPSTEVTDGFEALGDGAVDSLVSLFPLVKSDSERYGIGLALAGRGAAGDRGLVKLLRTPSLRGRRWLLQALAGHFTGPVVAALRDLVRDADRELAERAVLDLAESEDDQGVVLLRGVLRSPDAGLRQKAALALAFHADGTGVPILLDDLQDTKSGALALFQTMKGLGLSGSPSAVGPLAQVFAANAARISANEPPGRVTGLATFEARFRKMPLSERAMLITVNASQALQSLAIHGPHPEVVALLTHANPHVRRLALEVLGACGDASAAPAILRVIESGVSRAPAGAGRDAGTRGELGHAAASDSDDADSEGSRSARADAEMLLAAQALRTIAAPQVSPRLTSLLKRASEPLSTWIALALAAVDDPEGVRRAIALAHGQSEVTVAALSTLGRSGSTDAEDFLVSLMEGPDREMQLTAASAMSRPGHAHARKPLEALLATGKASDDPQRLSVAALGLGLTGDTGAVQKLEQLLQHADRSVRRSAVVGLYYLTGEARRYKNVWGEEARFEPTTFNLKLRQEMLARKE